MDEGDTKGGSTTNPNDLDVRSIRKMTGLSQDAFAKAFGFSLGSLRDWEQGRRRPEQAALTLLRVIAHNPEMVKSALRAVGADQVTRWVAANPPETTP